MEKKKTVWDAKVRACTQSKQQKFIVRINADGKLHSDGRNLEGY